MTKTNRKFPVSQLLYVAAIVVLSACCPPPKPPVFNSVRQQETFWAPEQAVNALMAANRRNNTGELLKILGPDAGKIINSGDPVADKESRERFVAAYEAGHELENASNNEKIITVGKEEWPLPIPLVREDGRWRFDTEAGEQEIINRRIGHNELNVIKICQAYVEAQREYAAGRVHETGHAEYAQKFFSTPGKHDGLYWPVRAGEKESPLGPFIADAQAEGYLHHGKHQPYHGYYYRILKAQGSHAAGKARSYVVKGHMTRGFAMIAFPATYGDSGIMSFIVNQNGIVYEKDLGPKTVKIAMHIKRFDPDNTWKIP